MSSKKASKSNSKFLLIFIFCAVLIIIPLVWTYKNYYRVFWVPTALNETSDPLFNPYCGWYHIYGYTLSDHSGYTVDTILNSCESDSDTRLALLEINLKNYRSGSISSYALGQLDTILTAWEQTDKKLIIRFLYDWDGKALETEPEDISIILNHMSQTASVINSHASAIYTLQGIFVGNCGEMNNSNYMSEQSMCMLINQLNKVTDPSIYLSVRTPAHWRQIAASFVPLTRQNAFLNTLSARTGLFNDGMLGSGNDTGTYGDNSLSAATKYSDKGTREDEINFQNQLCRYVPNGGEVIIDNPYNNLNAAIPDLFKMHVSYLDCDYDPNVLNKWKNSTYNGSGPFNGCSGYDYVGRHLGYRYVLRSGRLTFHTFKNKSTLLNIDLENTGFANCYKKFQVSLFLQNISTNKTTKLAVPTDTRSWLSGRVSNLKVPIDISSYAIGNYNIYFTINDPVTKQEIRLANTNHSSLGYFLGRLAIRKFS